MSACCSEFPKCKCDPNNSRNEKGYPLIPGTDEIDWVKTAEEKQAVLDMYNKITYGKKSQGNKFTPKKKKRK